MEGRWQNSWMCSYGVRVGESVKQVYLGSVPHLAKPLSFTRKAKNICLNPNFPSWKFKLPGLSNPISPY